MKRLMKIFLVIFVVFFAACEAIFLENITNDIVVVVAPKDNVQVEEGAVNFIWENILDASSYHLQIAKPTFNQASQIILDTTITKNSFTHTMKIGEYEWRVKAKNEEYETGYTTQSLEVINADIINSQVVLLLPLNNTISNVVSQKLLWTELTGAIEYRLQIWQPDDQGTKIKDIIVTESSYIHSFLEGNFMWRIRPQSASQNGEYSERLITIDSKKPNTPVNTSPDNNGGQTDTTVNFSWIRTAIAGTQEIDSIYVFTDASLTTLSFKEKGANKSYTKENVLIGSYHWYVQSFDTAGNKSEKSNTFMISVN